MFREAELKAVWQDSTNTTTTRRKEEIRCFFRGLVFLLRPRSISLEIFFSTLRFPTTASYYGEMSVVAAAEGDD